jgi:hypothetical protein
MEEEIINEFYQRMTADRVNKSTQHENYLKVSYRVILNGMMVNYEEYRRHVANFLSCLESNNTYAIPYSIDLFFELLDLLLGSKEFKPFDSSIMDFKGDDQTLEQFRLLYSQTLSANNRPRLSDNDFNVSHLASEDAKKMASLIIHKLQIDSKILNWNKEMVEIGLMQLILLRQLLISLNSKDFFYYTVGIFFDRITSSEYLQAGRDIAEEVIISSYKDGIPELGYFNSFRLYSNAGSIHAALFYANISLLCILKKPHPYSEKYVKEVIWQGMKCFRNVGLMPWSVKLYKAVPSKLNLEEYESRSLDHTYFSALLKMADESLPDKLLDYLNKQREKIFAEGIHDALPWLLLLYNIKRIYHTADFTSFNGLSFYLNVFEKIVPAETVKKQKDIIEGNSSDLIKHLKESLTKLNETRNKSDYVYDNETALKISSRLIVYAFQNKDVPAFLLAMIIKSDNTLLFVPKDSPGLRPLILPDINVESITTLYEDHKKFIDALPPIRDVSIIWLAFSEGKIYELELYNDNYQISMPNDWSHNLFKELLNKDYFANLGFATSVKENNGNVRSILPEEFAQQEDHIAKQLDFAKLKVNESSERVYIVKDISISKFPHNLFLDSEGKFIARRVPVTNILSTEWLINKKSTPYLDNNYGKSIWLPIDSGDWALLNLYGNIEDCLKKADFDIYTNSSLNNPLSSDINIICSHGGRDISEINVLYQQENPVYNLSSIIGKGRILIFFVCHSGSMKEELFRNNVMSMAKRFIAQGYDAVIAPFWALHISIPQYWLPEFLDSVNQGLSIDIAVFNANKKVSDVFPTPAAWACLHLYGSPHLKIKG